MHALHESDLEIVCAGCRQKHDNHFSSSYDEHDLWAHYKTKKCEHCGYEITFKTDKDCSGIHHDQHD